MLDHTPGPERPGIGTVGGEAASKASQLRLPDRGHPCGPSCSTPAGR